MRFVITGANGYIGSEIVKYFQDYPLLAISRAYVGIAHKTIYTDSLFSEDTIRELRKFNPTHIIHTAGYAHKSSFLNSSYKKDMKNINEKLTEKLFILSEQVGIPHFIFISSIAVHLSNGFSNKPYTEISAFDGDDQYSISKANAEKIINKLAKNSSMDFTILRPSMVYGRGAPGNFNKLIPLIDYGFIFPFKGIKNKRSFLSINNLLSAIECCCLNKNAKNQTFLIADKELISTSKLIKTIAEIRSIKNRQFRIPTFLFKILCKLPFIGKTFRIFTKDLIINTSSIKNKLGWIQPYSQFDELYKAFSKSEK